MESLDKVDLSKLRTKSDRDTRDRNERLKLPIDRAMAIYRTAPFNNCASWDVLEKQGLEGAQQIFHCALSRVDPHLLMAVEDRADLLGHGGDTETSERYCKPHEIAEVRDEAARDLQPQEINLISWVAAKQVAPFSHPRSKRWGFPLGPSRPATRGASIEVVVTALKG